MGLAQQCLDIYPNGGRFVLAIEQVSRENEEIWAWFLPSLSKVIDCKRRVIVLSDRQNELINAVRVIFSISYACCYM